MENLRKVIQSLTLTMMVQIKLTPTKKSEKKKEKLCVFVKKFRGHNRQDKKTWDEYSFLVLEKKLTNWRRLPPKDSIQHQQLSFDGVTIWKFDNANLSPWQGLFLVFP